jgi:hypothetical protein
MRSAAMSEPTADAAARAGLCASCAHVQIVASSRGSIFYMCRLSETNPAFKRYPSLPVLACPGYERRDAPSTP